jgi:CDP-glucose 4,6-dehydratase
VFLDSLKSGPVLITGHTGFKGTWLSLLLENLGAEVVGYSLPPSKGSLFELTERGGKTFEKYEDIRNLDELKKFVREVSPSFVLHLAAQPLVTEGYVNPTDTFATNVMGTANLLEACRDVKTIQKVGVVTTDKVYENVGLGRAFNELDPLGAADPYSASKVAAESAVRAWQTIFENDDRLKIVSLRSGNVIGGGDIASNRLLPDIIRAKYENHELRIRYPESTRPWQHALDPLFGYLLALGNNKSDIQKLGAFNFGPSSTSFSVRQVVEIAENYWHHDLEVAYDSPGSMNYEASLLDLDSTRSREKLGWSPKWDQHDAVISTLSWWDQVKLKNLTALEACKLDIGQITAKYSETEYRDA